MWNKVVPCNDDDDDSLFDSVLFCLVHIYRVFRINNYNSICETSLIGFVMFPVKQIWLISEGYWLFCFFVPEDFCPSFWIGSAFCERGLLLLDAFPSDRSAFVEHFVRWQLQALMGFRHCCCCLQVLQDIVVEEMGVRRCCCLLVLQDMSSRGFLAKNVVLLKKGAVDLAIIDLNSTHPYLIWGPGRHRTITIHLF